VLKLFKILFIILIGLGLSFGSNIAYKHYSKLDKLIAREEIKQSLVKVMGRRGYGSIITTIMDHNLSIWI